MAMSATTWRILTAFMLTSAAQWIVGARAERIMGQEVNDDFDFDGLPGVQHEFKVEVGGGEEQCFHQKVAMNASLQVSFEVLRGGDMKVDLVIRNSMNMAVDAVYWKPKGMIDYKVTAQDTYSICVDNSFARFTSKLVYVYIKTFKMADWRAFVKDFVEIRNIAANLTTSLASVEMSVHKMRISQTKARLHVARDFYQVQNNFHYVQRWSLMQGAITLVASVAQVVALRRMFRTTHVTPSAKPRA